MVAGVAVMACDELLTLPATSDLVVNITVSAEARPYLVEFFQDLKKSGETPEQFILRNLIIKAVQHRLAKLVNECQNSQETVKRSYQIDLEAEQTAILSSSLP